MNVRKCSGEMASSITLIYRGRMPMACERTQPSQLNIDAEIEAMQRSGIDVRAWYFWVNTEDPENDPNVKKTLESFKRHNIHPQIWVPQSFARHSVPSKGVVRNGLSDGTKPSRWIR